MAITLVNGTATDTLSVKDRALQYGDGLFETIAVRGATPCFWQQHMDRLLAGCQRLNIPLPDVTKLYHEVMQVIDGTDQAVIKIIISRGNSGRGYAYLVNAQAGNRIITIANLPVYPAQFYTEGVDLYLCQTRLGLNPMLAGVKHLNRLEQVLARNEWSAENYAEGLVRDINDFVIEGCMSNLFVEKNGQLFTPDLSHSGVQGIAKQLIMDIARKMQTPVIEKTMTLQDVEQSDGLYLSNSLIAIWPVKSFNQNVYSGVMHPVMAKAQRLLLEDA